MPSSTVSRRVQQLEEQVGTRLLQRSTRKLTLTSAGEAFSTSDAPARVDGLIDASREELMSDTNEASGLVAVRAG